VLEGAAIHHSITLSARCRSDCGSSAPNALAVLRLITNSNFVGCSTGRSAGLVPLRIRSMYPAAEIAYLFRALAILAQDPPRFHRPRPGYPVDAGGACVR
jgi:hypothetical protein